MPLKIHEYQAKEIFSGHGVPVPKGGVATTPAEAAKIALDLGGRVVVKAQVHAGGRGKAGGVKLVSSAQEAESVAGSLLGSRLVTHQTGPDGVPVRRVLVEEAVEVAKELYLSVVIDGGTETIVVMASEAGGVEIEEVAEQTPEKILRVEVDPALGLMPFQSRRLAYGLKVDAALVRPVVDIIASVYRVFETLDCSLAEINPLVVTSDGRALAVDAKLNFDDDALFKHPELREMYDVEQEDAYEARAREYGISFVKLEGDVGCMVNGAGLAMATMDITRTAGATPANFLDVGGGADEDKVARATTLLLSDPAVKRVLVNIFGGILRCDVVARGLIQGAESMGADARPMVVRMLGTNAEEGRRLLADSTLDVTLVEDLAEAARAIGAADQSRPKETH